MSEPVPQVTTVVETVPSAPQSPQPAPVASVEIPQSPKPAPAASQGPPPPSASYPPPPPSPTPSSPGVVLVENPEQIKLAAALPSPVGDHQVEVDLKLEHEAAEKAAADKAAKDKAEKEAADKALAEKLAKELAEKEKAEKDKAAAEKAAKDLAEKEAAEKAAAEKLAKEAAEKEKAKKETAEIEAAALATKEQAEREAGEKDKAEKTKAAKEKADRDAADHAAKEVIEKTKAAQNQADKDQAERDAAVHAAKEKAAKEQLVTPKVEVVKDATDTSRPIEIIVEKPSKSDEPVDKSIVAKAGPVEVVVEKPSPAKSVEIVEKPTVKPSEVVMESSRSTKGPVGSPLGTQSPLLMPKGPKTARIVVEQSETKCPAACKCTPYCKCTVCRCHEQKSKGHELSEQIRQVVIVEPPMERKINWLHKLKPFYWMRADRKRARNPATEKARKRDQFRNRVLGRSSLAFLIGRHHATVIQPSMEASAASRKADSTGEERANVEASGIRTRNSCSDFRRSLVTKMHDKRGNWHKRQADMHSEFAVTAERSAWDEGVKYHIQRAELHARKQLKHAERHLRGRKRYTFQEDHAAERHLNEREHQRGRWLDMEERHRDASRNYEDKRRDGERYLREARLRLEQRLESDKQKLEAKGSRLRQHFSRPNVPSPPQSIEASRLDMDYTRPGVEENVIYTKPHGVGNTLHNAAKDAARTLRRDVRSAEADVKNSAVKDAVLAANEMRERRLSQREPLVEFDVDRSSASVHFDARYDGSSVSTPIPGMSGQQPIATNESLKWDVRAGGPSVRARHKLFSKPTKEMMSISDVSSSDASTKSTLNGKTTSRQQSWGLQHLAPQPEADDYNYPSGRASFVRRVHSLPLLMHLNTKMSLKRLTSKTSQAAPLEMPRSRSPSPSHHRSPPPKPSRWRRLSNRARRVRRQHGPNKAMHQSPEIRRKMERTFSIGSKDGSTERCHSVSRPVMSCMASLGPDDMVSILKV